MSFQYPVEIPGVSNKDFLFKAYNANQKAKGAPEMTVEQFDLYLNEKVDLMEVKSEFTSRNINEGFSGGEKKMLSLGRALMMNPSLVLLDEPSEGLAPLVIRKLIETIGEIRKHGLTLLLADQNLKFCRQVCEYGYILEKGAVVYEGSMEAIWSSEDVVKRYLAV
jgi:ABC-type branched-subunit amino acid transport system ATPase component